MERQYELDQIKDAMGGGSVAEDPSAVIIDNAWIEVTAWRDPNTDLLEIITVSADDEQHVQDFWDALDSITEAVENYNRTTNIQCGEIFFISGIMSAAPIMVASYYSWNPWIVVGACMGVALAIAAPFINIWRRKRKQPLYNIKDAVYPIA